MKILKDCELGYVAGGFINGETIHIGSPPFFGRWKNGKAGYDFLLFP